MHRLRRFVGPLFVIAVFLGVSSLLYQELHEYELRDFIDSLTAIPVANIALAAAFACSSYTVLIGYDLLAIHFFGHKLPLGRVVLASVVGHTVGHNLGAVLGGGAVRYRVYSAGGLTALEIAKIVLMLGVTFWTGIFVLAGTVFLVKPMDVPENLNLPFATTRPIGYLLISAAVAYFIICALRRSPIKIWKWQFSLPPLRLALLQFLVASVESMLSAGILFAVLPTSVKLDYFEFLSIYLLSIVASVVSQVPGGLGVFDYVVIKLVDVPEKQMIVGSLLAFRTVYYLMPLFIGLLLLVGHEWTANNNGANGVDEPK